MSGRVRWVAGLGAVALLVVAVIMLRQDDPPTPSKGHPEARSTPIETKPIDARPVTAKRLVGGSPDEATPQPAAELRDRTGEPLSAGPAQPLALPERDESEVSNMPSTAEIDEVTDRVLERLADEIAEAKAAGDTDTARRLEVRKARLERRRASRGVDEDAATTG